MSVARQTNDRFSYLSTKRISTNKLKISNELSILNADGKYKNIIEIAQEEVDSNYGIPGVIRGKTNKIRKQIVTPNDLDSNHNNIYKFILNNASLEEINLYNANNEQLEFHSLNIITIDSGYIQPYPNSYNSLESGKYYHDNSSIQYLQITGDFHSLEYGILTWVNDYSDKKTTVTGYTNNNYTQYIINDIWIFPSNKSIDLKPYIKKNYQNNEIELNFINHNNNANVVLFNNTDIRIKTNDQYTNESNPLEITVSIKGERMDTIKFLVYDNIVDITENEENWFHSNLSQSDPNSIFIHAYTTLYFYEFNADYNNTIEHTHEIQKFKSTLNISDYVINFQYANIGYSTYKGSKTFHDSSPLYYTISTTNSFKTFHLNPYKPDDRHHRIFLNSFLNSPLDYYVKDDVVSTTLNNSYLHYLPSENNTVYITSRNPIVEISYSIYDYSSKSYATFTNQNNLFESISETNSIIYFPYLYEQFDISIIAGNNFSKTYHFENSFYNIKSPIIFVENSHLFFNCYNEVIANCHSSYNDFVDGESLNSFSIYFLSFYEYNINDVSGILSTNIDSLVRLEYENTDSLIEFLYDSNSLELINISSIENYLNANCMDIKLYKYTVHFKSSGTSGENTRITVNFNSYIKYSVIYDETSLETTPSF